MTADGYQGGSAVCGQARRWPGRQCGGALESGSRVAVTAGWARLAGGRHGRMAVVRYT
jgi:hypothetical protein